MIIGQVLQADAGSTATFWSPWMPATGNAAAMSCEVIQSTSLKFYVTVETKNTEDDDDSATSPYGTWPASMTMTAETITTFEAGDKLSSTTHLGFLELFRYKYEVDNTSGSEDPGFVHFRMLNPAWLTH